MVMATLQRTLAIIVYLLKPVLVKNYELMTEQVGLTNVEFSFAELKTFKTIKFKKLGDKKIIYQRLK